MEAKTNLIYSCPLCGLTKISVEAETKDYEFLAFWKNLTLAVTEDHKRRSPKCKNPKNLLIDKIRVRRK